MRTRGQALGLILVFLLVSSSLISAPSAEARQCTQGELGCGEPECLVELSGCYPEPPVAAPATCDTLSLGLHQPVKIRGHVLGPDGQGVSDACVYWKTSWGEGSAKTGQSGDFVIDMAVDELDVYLYSSKSLMTWDRILIGTPLTASQESHLLRISFTHVTLATPSYINTLQSADVVITMYSGAPASATKALAQLAPGTTLELSHDPNYQGSAGVSRWQGQMTISTGQPQGTIRLPSCIIAISSTGDCSDSQGAIVFSDSEPVTNQAWYMIDNTAPELKLISPQDNGNSLPISPTIVAQATDPFVAIGATSGISADSITAVLLDETSGISSVLSPMYDGRFIRAGASVVAGHHYRISVGVSDRSGNRSTFSSVFHAMTSASATSPASVTTEGVGPSSKFEGLLSDTYTWSDVAATVAEFSVTIDGTGHTGDGLAFVDFTIPTGAVKYTLAGVHQSADIRNSASKTASSVFSVTTTGTVVTVAEEQPADIGSVVADLPKGAENVRLSFQATPSRAPYFSVCADPTSSQSHCSTDPLTQRQATTITMLPEQLKVIRCWVQTDAGEPVSGVANAWASSICQTEVLAAKAEVWLDRDFTTVANRSETCLGAACSSCSFPFVWCNEAFATATYSCGSCSGTWSSRGYHEIYLPYDVVNVTGGTCYQQAERIVYCTTRSP